MFLVVLLATVITDALNGPAPAPTYLTGLLGATATAFFAAASSDKNKREREVSDTATRAESKADTALGQSAAVSSMADSVLAVQERQLLAERAALQAMYDAVEAKEVQGIPVLRETRVTIEQMERQIKLLDAEVEQRRAHASSPAEHAQVDLGDSGGEP
jgi:hypothetical protein